MVLRPEIARAWLIAMWREGYGSSEMRVAGRLLESYGSRAAHVAPSIVRLGEWDTTSGRLINAFVAIATSGEGTCEPR